MSYFWTHQLNAWTHWNWGTTAPWTDPIGSDDDEGPEIQRFHWEVHHKVDSTIPGIKLAIFHQKNVAATITMKGYVHEFREIQSWRIFFPWNIWRFPKIGVPLVIIHFNEFSVINQPAIGYPDGNENPHITFFFPCPAQFWKSSIRFPFPLRRIAPATRWAATRCNVA